MKIEKIAVIGGGSWGTALSLLLAKKGCEIPLWVYEKDLCAVLQEKRENPVFLPGFPLPESVHPSNCLETVVRGRDVVVLVVPTHVMRSLLTRLRPHLQPGCLIINASKGLENETLCPIHQIVTQEILSPFSLATVSGPTFALEIAQETPSALVAASATREVAERVQRIFSAPYLKTFISTDLLGVELGGALKNVIAIATGISDGLGLGYNARAALITRGLVEITRIGTALGARPETFAGLSGMGDLVLTCTGELSRNRSVGWKLGQGQTLREITESMKMVAEGVRTVKSAFALKQKFGIQASIIEETYRVLHEEKSPQKALEDIMKVEISHEFVGVKGLE